MKIPNFTDPQFVDAVGVGGLNAAFGQVSGAIGSVGLNLWAQTGLVSPESMALSFSNMVGSVNLPSPWGIATSSGVVVRAHGTQTSADTTSYSVNFAPLVPGSGTIVAYLAATITQIQQNPFPLTGPPQGHPSFNPNFVPSTAYATTVFSVSLAAVTGVPDNINTFELARTTLTAGQVTISSFSTLGWQRASPYSPRAASLVSGGALPLSLSALTALPNAPGLTSTLPLVASGGGLNYQLVNPSASTVWTVAAPTGNTITGGYGTPVPSIGIPAYGAVNLWGNAASGVWEILGVNPLMMASLPNVFTATQTINVSGTTAPLVLSCPGAEGVNVLLTGNGTATPSKWLRVFGGVFGIIDSAYTTAILSLDDAGNMAVPGQLAGANLAISGPGTIGNGLNVGAGGVISSGVDAGGLQFRTIAGTSPGAGFRNDGNTFYLLMSADGAPRGGFNALRPFQVNLRTGALVIDGTGAGVIFNGRVQIADVVSAIGTIGGVSFPGGGSLNTAGSIDAGGSIVGAAIATPAGNITAGARLRAAFGAYLSGDANAACILNDFLLFSNNSGYVRIPNGWMVQWGQISLPINNLAAVYNLNIAFPNNFWAIIISIGAFGPTQGNAVGAQPSTLSQYVAALATPVVTATTDGCYWIAVGN